ncbi:MAG: hypothetical protein U5N10_11940 [Gemmobacter sp.]|nr:hypothetical protein [Gemmobacter sp.]
MNKQGFFCVLQARSDYALVKQTLAEDPLILRELGNTSGSITQKETKKDDNIYNNIYSLRNFIYRAGA